jgi:hypothetical protein
LSFSVGSAGAAAGAVVEAAGSGDGEGTVEGVAGGGASETGFVPDDEQPKKATRHPRAPERIIPPLSTLLAW